MKYLNPSLVFSVICAGLIFTTFSSTANARIGDRKESLERRLFASGGILYRDDVIEANRRRGMPYLKYLELLSDSAEIRVYYKTADGRRPSSKNLDARRMLPGWDLHVLYVNGKSVVEVYQRSQALSAYELNELLARQSQGSFWKKIEKPKSGEKSKKPLPSAFGYEMELANGALRAKKVKGNGLMIFDTNLDAKLAEMKDLDMQSKAPQSVEGF